MGIGPMRSPSSTTAVISDSLTLSWNRVAGAQKYIIFQEGIQIAEVPADVLTYQLSGLSPGQHNFVVSASTTAGTKKVGQVKQSKSQNIIVMISSAPGAPSAPQNLQATPIAQGITLSWQVPNTVGDGISKYRISAIENPSTGVPLVPLGLKATPIVEGVHLTWNAPKDTGGGIINYTISAIEN
jgi:hypothetical protein